MAVSTSYFANTVIVFETFGVSQAGVSITRESVERRTRAWKDASTVRRICDKRQLRRTFNSSVQKDDEWRRYNGEKRVCVRVRCTEAAMCFPLNRACYLGDTSGRGLGASLFSDFRGIYCDVKSRALRCRRTCPRARARAKEDGTT